jgi:hypothetical protein
MYDMGELIGERDYDSSRDWGDIEALGRAEAKAGEKEAETAVAEVKKTSVYIKRAKTSQKVRTRLYSVSRREVVLGIQRVYE